MKWEEKVISVICVVLKKNKKQQHLQCCAYLVNVCLEPATCTYGRMTRIFNVSVWRDGVLMVHPKQSAHMYTLTKKKKKEKHQCLLKPNYKVFFFLEKAFVKVYPEQTDRQTDGRTNRRQRVSTLTHLSLARELKKKKQKKKKPPGNQI